ncbi:WD40-repeat-containing domain protein [Rhodofomes roseus]|uniref:WD40-repeat-containing domain protein n=1 Tax=Rhodofomes roseus TaxID=34475 RepID=A0ABQ8KIT7_9APHY|nr:WD40-repeat-containing domain protein [Rhodofomes roseus]KAH9837873.1 WD40-repeat-containing domain protein [Rhodofomes roseus]
MNAGPAASEVYAQQLFKLALGYPLWEPEPKNGQGEVLIGDVGYLNQGGFYRLFNAMKDADDPIQQYRVPRDYKKFDLGLMQVVPANNVVNEGPIFSQTVHRTDIGGGAGSHGVNFAFQCECADQNGALAILDTPGRRELVHQSRRMTKHMKENIETWHHWASEEVGLEVAIEDILFVRGWIKTSRWAVVAFFGNSRHARLSFTGDLGLPVSAAFHVDIQRETAATCLPRIGPDNRPRFNPGRPSGPAQPAPELASPVQSQSPKGKRKKGKNRADDTDPRHSKEMDWGSQVVAAQEYPSDQCIFLHYFKLKKRLLLPSKIEAAAEPQDPSVDRDTDDGMGLIEEVPPKVTPYDPVIFVLDYILENSHADVAIASDLDLIRICKARFDHQYPIPDDIPHFLEENRPDIEVTEDGLGMLLFDDEVTEMLIAESANAADVQHDPHTTDPGQAEADPQKGAADDDIEMGGGPVPGASDDNPVIPPDNLAEDKGKRVDRPNILHMPALTGTERRGGISALAYSPVGRDIAAGFENNTIMVWSTMNQAVRHQFQDHGGAVSSLVFSPDGNKLVSGGRDGRVIIWDLIAGGMIRTLHAHEGTVDCVAYSPDGKLFASAAGDSVVKLWEAESGNLRASTEEHNGIIMSILFSPDNERFVSTSAEGTAHVWSTHTASHICDLQGHEGVIYTAAYSSDGRRLITGSDDGTARVWSALLGEEFMTLSEGDGGSVWAATFSTDGRHLHYVGSERIIKTYDSYTADLLHSIDCGDKVAMGMTFSADGRLLAAGGEDHVVTVWDMATKREVAQYNGHTDNVNYLAFSHDNKHLASASDDGSVRKWDLPVLPAVA